MGIPGRDTQSEGGHHESIQDGSVASTPVILRTRRQFLMKNPAVV